MRETSAARFYELMVITTPDGTPEELIGVVEQITGYVETAGGTILRANYDSPWGRRRLSYPIRHESQDVRDGFYTLVHLEIAPNSIATIERDLKLNDRLMRYLVLQLASEPVFPEPDPEEPEGEKEAAPAEAAASDAPAATTAVDKPTAVPVDGASGEETAEDRRSVVASADTESEGEEAEEPAAPDEVPEPSAESSEGITEVPAEPEDGSTEETEVPAEPEDGSPEEKE